MSVKLLGEIWWESFGSFVGKVWMRLAQVAGGGFTDTVTLQITSFFDQRSDCYCSLVSTERAVWDSMFSV